MPPPTFFSPRASVVQPKTSISSPIAYTFEKVSHIARTLIKATIIFYKTILFYVAYTLSSRFINYENWIHFSLSHNVYEDVRNLLLHYLALEFPEREIAVPAKNHKIHLKSLSVEFCDELTSGIKELNQSIKLYNAFNRKITQIRKELKEIIYEHNNYHTECKKNTIKITLQSLGSQLAQREETKKAISKLLSGFPLDQLDETISQLSTDAQLSKPVETSFLPIVEIDDSVKVPLVADKTSAVSYFLGSASQDIETVNQQIKKLVPTPLVYKTFYSCGNTQVKHLLLKDQIVEWNHHLHLANSRGIPKAVVLPLSEKHPNLLPEKAGLGEGYLAFPAKLQTKKPPKKGRWILYAPPPDHSKNKGCPLTFHEMLGEALQHLVEKNDQKLLMVNTEKLFSSKKSLEKYLLFLEKEMEAEEIVLVGDQLGSILVGETVKKHEFLRGKKYLVIRSRTWTNNCSYLQQKFSQTLQRQKWKVPTWISNLCNEYIAAVMKFTGCNMDARVASQVLKDHQIHEYLLEQKELEEVRGIPHSQTSLFHHTLSWGIQKIGLQKKFYSISSTSAPEFLKTAFDSIKDDDLSFPSIPPMPISSPKAHPDSEDH